MRSIYSSCQPEQSLFSLDQAPPVTPRYNIAPTQPVLAIRDSYVGNGREATFFNWGLIPSWATDPGVGSRMINARAETAGETVVPGGFQIPPLHRPRMERFTSGRKLAAVSSPPDRVGNRRSFWLCRSVGALGAGRVCD